MRLTILKSTAFVFASAALLSLGMSVAAEASGTYKGKPRGDYCEAKLDKLETKYDNFLIKYDDILNGPQSKRKTQAEAKQAKYLHKINSFSFEDCVCDDDSDCDVSPS